MKWDILLLALFACCVGGKSRAAPKIPAAANDAGEDSVYVDVREDWKAWLEHNFPDASKTWPADCAKALALIVGDGKWDFIGKGNIDRDAVPTALLVRVRSINFKKIT